jgi:hypothetical protein
MGGAFYYLNTYYKHTFLPYVYRIDKDCENMEQIPAMKLYFFKNFIHFVQFLKPLKKSERVCKRMITHVFCKGRVYSQHSVNIV